ncbi:MAG: DNA replication/repair protein RecF [Patescibacteria group bacterium]|nr:DNA replication/repair protein RecF [Patescibacteria group bacterium]
MSVLKKLKLQNFRNISNAEIDFVKNNFILGSNSQGKTNILEAIYSLSTGNSFRGHKDSWVIKTGELYAKLEAEFLIDDEQISIELFWERDEDSVNRVIRINKTNAKKKDILNKSFMVLFSPDLVYLLKTSSTNRRKFLDDLLSKVYIGYYDNLSGYNQALRQRNMLLKLRNASPEDLEVWNQKLIQYGSKINQARQEVSDEINKRSQAWFKKLAPENPRELKLTYSGTATSKEDYKNKLKNVEYKDKQFGYTNFGPHREDLHINLGGFLANQLASQGEFRLIVLAIKLAEGEYGKEMIKRPAIYLLDDVFSELDIDREQSVIESFAGGDQVIYTITDETIIKDDLAGRIRVEDGSVTKTTHELSRT